MDRLRNRINSIRRSSTPIYRTGQPASPSYNTQHNQRQTQDQLTHGDGLNPTEKIMSSLNPLTLGPPTLQGSERLPEPQRPYRNDEPLYADFDTPHFVIGGGVAIFHVATSRVVLCWHTRDRYWFLPKGRRDVGEDSGTGAEREGYEESGYRNRLLPLPFEHRQPSPSTLSIALPPLTAPSSPNLNSAQSPHLGICGSGSTGESGGQLPTAPRYVTEPILTQLLPVTPTRQYLLHWYVAETLPAGAEARVNTASAHAAGARGLATRQVYVRPPPWPPGLTLRARVEQDGAGETAMKTWLRNERERAQVRSNAGKRAEQKSKQPPIYEPKHHPNTGVDAEEALYTSELVPVGLAVQRLAGSGMEFVVRWGWDAICRRWQEEDQMVSDGGKDEYRQWI